MVRLHWISKAFFMSKIMANDPAFLFYPGDYLRDTQCLSEKAQVAYDRIMCEHMRNICITQAQLNFFIKRLNEDEKIEIKNILTKMPGGFQITWVAESIIQRRLYSESRRKNKQGKSKNISKSYDSHMEIENEIEIKDVFDKFPKNENLDFLPEMKINACLQLLKITRQIDINEKQVLGMWAVFRDQNITGEKFYKSKDDIYSHFINWIKTQKFEDANRTSTNSAKLGTSAARIEAARKF